MTNLRGAMMYVDANTVSSESYIEQNIASLGIIAPWTISARVRQKRANLTGIDQFAVNLIIGFGGDADDNYQILLLEYDDDNFEVLQANGDGLSDSMSAGASGTTFDTIKNNSWQWIQLQLEEDGTLTARFAEDTSTSIPATWDRTNTDTVSDFTAESVIQSIKFGLKESDFTGGAIAILEIDEIHVIQD